jgi:hypothetical protein
MNDEKKKSGRLLKVAIIAITSLSFLVTLILFLMRGRPDTAGPPPPMQPPATVEHRPTTAGLPPPMKLPPAITPTRIFSGPGQYPPKDFRAYGILVFPHRPTAASRARHLMICDAYVAALPHFTELPDVPSKDQMVTVWPIENDEVAKELDLHTPRRDVCQLAVDHYGLVLARAAIKDAIKAQQHELGRIRGDPVDFGNLRRGPFLLGWAPGSQKGAPDALVLVLDLTRIDVPGHAEAVFERWIREIEQNPLIWTNGWDVFTVRLRIRLWADDIGERVVGWFINND